MDPNVKTWLLSRAVRDLRKARSSLKEARVMVKEYENRVRDPGWNLGSSTSGKETWGCKVKEWKKARTESTKKVAFLEKVVKALE